MTIYDDVVAVDGPAGAGKGTLARGLAAHLGFAYLDTGLLYRAVAARALDLGGRDSTHFTAAAGAITEADFASPRLRSDSVAQAASLAAAVPEVRAALLAFQRSFAHQPPGGTRGAVLDGRDIGTVVCPHARYKFFVIADLAIRAARRLKELRERGHAVIHADVLRDMQERDSRDSARSLSPLMPAADAFVLDTSDLGPGDALAAALAYISSRDGTCA